MFKRKLTALGYPEAASFSIDDSHQMRSVVLFLEDMKIRQYKIDERGDLRDLTAEKWHDCFLKYLADLACPYPLDSNIAVLFDWLLGLAVSLEYSDNAESLKGLTGEIIAANRQKSTKATVVSQNPLDCLDFEGAEFKQGVGRLAALLKIPQHQNHLITLEAVSKFVQERLSKERVENAKANATTSQQATPMSLETYGSGVETPQDRVLADAARALRLLHVDELRRLQTRVNEAIVAVQQLTADPRTDDRLGQVGRK